MLLSGVYPRSGWSSSTGIAPLVNFFGIRRFARVNNFLTVIKLAIPAACFVILLRGINTRNFHSYGFAPYGFTGIISALYGGSVIFASLGFEQADQLAGEARHPQRDLPFAIIGSVLISIVMYALAQVVFVGTLSSSKLAHGFEGIDLSGYRVTDIANVLGIGWLIGMFRVYLVIAPLGTGMTYLATTPRLSLAMARNRYVPAVFGRIDRRGVPRVGLVFSLALSCLVLVFYGNLQARLSRF
jgi:amino acid transporter